MPLKPFQEEDEDVWVIENISISNTRPNIRISANSEGEAPNAETIARIENLIENIEPIILKASSLILENYSFDHFKKLGVDEDLLVEETAEAIASAVTLVGLFFFDFEGSVDEFEASFTVPWDPHHSFDIEHEDGEPICCAVNG